MLKSQKSSKLMKERAQHGEIPWGGKRKGGEKDGGEKSQGLCELALRPFWGNPAKDA